VDRLVHHHGLRAGIAGGARQFGRAAHVIPHSGDHHGAIGHGLHRQSDCSVQLTRGQGVELARIAVGRDGSDAALHHALDHGGVGLLVDLPHAVERRDRDGHDRAQRRTDRCGLYLHISSPHCPKPGLDILAYQISGG
jgi:hypothetical protein